MPDCFFPVAIRQNHLHKLLRAGQEIQHLHCSSAWKTDSDFLNNRSGKPELIILVIFTYLSVALYDKFIDCKISVQTTRYF